MDKEQKLLKTREDMKKFIEIRRNQMKIAKQSSETTDKLNQLILSNSSDSFLDQLRQLKSEYAYNYLLTPDGLLKTPIALALQQNKWSQILKSINDWSLQNRNMIEDKFEQSKNPQTAEGLRNDFHYILKARFQQIIRGICMNKKLQQKQLVVTFSQKNTLLEKLMSLFLSYQNIIGLVPQNQQFRLFSQVFSQIATNLHLLQTADDITKFANFKHRQKAWTNNQFIGLLGCPQILTLKEVHYNFMHELAIKQDDKSIYQILEKLESGDSSQQNQNFDEIKQNYFCSFNDGGETPIDIILWRWPSDKILKFLQKVKEIEYINLSINCLNKIIRNSKLKQKQVFSLILIMLDGEIASRGYCQRVMKQKLIKTKRFQKIIHRYCSEYVIVMDRRRVLMAKDTKQSYPLLNYLDRFGRQNNLKAVSKLSFQLIDRQVTKTKVISLLKNIGIQSKQFPIENEALKQIQQVIYYHQSLLNLVCRLPHGDLLLQYFVDKLFINYFSISIWSKTNGNPILHMVNRHFLTSYIEIHEDLKDNKINRKILQKIFQTKQNQKFAKDFNIYIELLRQFKQNNLQKKGNEWLVIQIKKKIKAYLLTLDKEKFIELYTYLNEGQKQRKVLLIQLIHPIFSQQQILSMRLPQKPIVQQKPDNRLKKIQMQKIATKNKLNFYIHNRNQQNFIKQLTIRIKQRQLFEANGQKRQLQKLKQQQKQKAKKEQEKQNQDQNGQQNLQQKQKKQIENKDEDELEWKLELDESDLNKKIKLLIDEGFKVRFKTIKVLDKKKENQIMNALEEPIKTIVRNMLKYIDHNKKNKNSLYFHIVCLCCDEQDVQRVYQFLLQASPKFKKYAGEDWQTFNKNKLTINPILMLKIIQNIELNTIYKLNNPDIVNDILIGNIRQEGINRLLHNLKTKPQDYPKHIQLMLAYREIEKQFDRYKINSSNIKIFNQQFKRYMKMHSIKINLTAFYKQISNKQIFQKFDCQIFVNACKISQKPISIILYISQQLKNLQAKIKIQRKENQRNQLKQQQLQKIQSQQQQSKQFKIISMQQKYHINIKQQYCKVLNSLNQKDFKAYFEAFPPQKRYQFKTLINNLDDENKCIQVLNMLVYKCLETQKAIKESSEEQNYKLNLQFSNHVNFLVKANYDRLNAALCAFMKDDNQIRLRCVSSQNKLPLQHKQFIKICKQDAFQLYLANICHMLQLKKTNLSQKQKSAIIFGIFTTLFHAQEWLKATKLVLKLIEPVKNQKHKGQQNNQNESEQYDPIKSFLQNSFSLCAKNKTRESNYKNKKKQNFKQVIDSLFKLLQNDSYESQILFENAWIVEPERTIKIIKIRQISLLTLARCLNAYPSKIKLVQRMKISQKHMPKEYRVKIEENYLPISAYSVRDFQKHPYLVDLLIFQEKLKNKWLQSLEAQGQSTKQWEKYSSAFEQKKRCVFLVKQIMSRYQEVYTQAQILKYSGQIFSSNTLKSTKDVPKAYLDAYFQNRKQLTNLSLFVGLSSYKQQIIKQLIDLKYIQTEHALHIIKSSRLSIIQYFLAKNNLKIDYNLIQQIQNKLTNSSFILTLLNLEGETFCIDFVNKYKILDLYPGSKYEEMTRDILWAVAFLHRTEFLKLFVKHLSEKFKGKKLNFVEAPLTNPVQEMNINKQPCQNDAQKELIEEQNIFVSKQQEISGVRNQIIYLPIRIAVASNFYEYYFLLKANNLQPSIKFKPSRRFLFINDFQPYSFIPEMKKKIQLFQKVLKIYSFLNGITEEKGNPSTRRSNSTKAITLGIIFSGALQLQSWGQQIKKLQENHPNYEEQNQLLKLKTIQKLKLFLHLVADGEFTAYKKLLQIYKQNLYFIILLIKTLKDVKVSDQQLIKICPAQAKLVIELLKVYPIKVAGHQYIHQIIHKHERLRSLIYIQNPKYLKQCNYQSIQNWAILFSHPFALQCRYFEQPQNLEFANQFIQQCFYHEQRQFIKLDTAKPFEYHYNQQKLKDILVCCICSRFEGTQTIMKQFCTKSDKDKDQLFIELALQLCTLKTFNSNAFESGNPTAQQNYFHNPAIWRSLTQTFLKMQKIQKFYKKNSFQPFFYGRFSDLVDFQLNKQALTKISTGLTNVFSCLSFLSNLIYLISQQKQIQYFVDQTLKLQDRWRVRIQLGNQFKIVQQRKIQQIQQQTYNTYFITVPYQILQTPPMRLIRIDQSQIKNQFQRKLFWDKMQINQIFISPMVCLSQLQFSLDVDSIKKIKSFPIIRKIIGEVSESLTKIIKQNIETLNQSIKQQSQGKIYSLSDVYGPIAINEQTNKTKVIQCLSFYQLNELPKSKIIVKYVEKRQSIQNSAQTLISDLRQYIRHFTYQINDDQSENKIPYQFSNVIILTPKIKNPDSLQVIYDSFYPYNIVRFINKINKFGRQISATFNNQIVFKYSIPSVLRTLQIIIRSISQLSQVYKLLSFVDQFLYSKRHLHFIQQLLIMILEDANNIMRAVKGILLSFVYELKHQLKADQKAYRINKNISYYGIGYQIDEQIFKIYLKIGPNIQQKQYDPLESNLISRKQFLNTVFSSTEFLVGYFVNKNAIANELVKASKQISGIVNSVVNFSINFRQLQRFIDKIRQTMSIRDMDGLLTNLSSFINLNYKKFVLGYISSKELALQHQVLLINCFQKMGTNHQSSQANQQQIKFKVSGTTSSINQIFNFASQLKSSSSKQINIKSVYLIQIYKNYFTSVMRQGMTCILGHKTNKPTLIITLQKKQDIDKVNISQLSFILLVLNRVPTHDQIDHNKIIKIFVTDLNQNIYELNNYVTQKLLQLPEESQNRDLAHLVPVLQSNIILGFSSEYSDTQKKLADDTNHRYLDLMLTKQSKFKIKIKNKTFISCANLLKIDSNFNKSIQNLSKCISSYINSNIQLIIRVPAKFEAYKAVQILNFAFLDFQQMLANIFIGSPRNKNLQIFVSAHKNEQIKQNIITRQKRMLFQFLYSQIIFQVIQQGESKMNFDQKKITIFLNTKTYQQLNTNYLSDSILKYQINKVVSTNKNIQQFYQFQTKNEDLLSILEHLLIASYQISAIQHSIKVLQMSSITKIIPTKFKLKLNSEDKSSLTFSNQILILNIRLKSPKRQFFTSVNIIQFVLNKFQLIIEPVAFTRYNAQQQVIQFYNYDSASPVTLIFLEKQNVRVKQIKLPMQGVNKKSKQPYKFNQRGQYYVVQKQGQHISVTSNYFWNFDKSVNYIKEKKNSNLITQKNTLLLWSGQPIDLGQCNINLLVHLAKNEKANEIANITKKLPQLKVQIYLLSKQIMKVQIVPLLSSTITIQLGKYKFMKNQNLQSLSITSTSGGSMVQENTRFLQLIFRNKTLKPSINQGQKKQQNLIFNQPAEKLEINQKDIKNKPKTVEEMVYIVNEDARKFLTRAGQFRIDIINICDSEGNPIPLQPNTKIFFRHLNIGFEIIIPQIKYDNETHRVQLKWQPTIRGPYEIILNNTRLNPNYQIGVCAAVAEIKSCSIVIPKKTEICFMQQTQCSLVLKDNYGNIYTQLEQAIIKDELLIKVISTHFKQQMIKSKFDKIDKYGLKRIRFSIDDPTATQQKKIAITILINMEVVVEFDLLIKGQSLSQRRKNMEKQIQNATKRYHIDVTVSRNNFMQSLFKIAEKSLDKNFSINFAGQQGIDAGGLKRQFYDMIGKQMKDPQNPFFIQTDRSRHNQYYINPELLKNKKKCEYMQLFGKYLANSFMNGYLIGINFSPTFVKLLYNDELTFDDVLSVLPKEEATRYQFLMNANAQYIQDLQLYFSCVVNKKKGIQVEMIENGNNVKVTKQNVKQYLSLLPQFLIVQRYKQIIDSFRNGFDSVFNIQINRKWLRHDEFWCMTAGVKQITPQIVLSYTNIQGGKETHHAWFRAFITEASKEILQGFLKFSSGSSSIDFYQTSKISVVFQNQGDNPKKLPISHTCWKQIQIPAYKSYAIMKQLLNAAFLYCSEGFGFG